MDNILMLCMTERHLKFVQGLARYIDRYSQPHMGETGSGFGTPISVYIFAISAQISNVSLSCTSLIWYP